MSLSDDLKKIFAGQRTRAGEAGQAVLEYILVLIVSVSILLGLLYQFNDAFKNFLDSYFGDYIACLLETGELPSLGGDGPTSAECNSGFENFNIASGRKKKLAGNETPPVEATSAGGGPDSGADGGGGAGRAARFNSAGNTANGEFGNGGIGSNNNRPARQRLNTRSNGIPEAAAGESTDDGGGFGLGRRRRIIRRRRIPIPESFLTRQAKVKKPGKTVISGKAKKGSRGLSSLRKAKFMMTPPEDKSVAPKVAVKGLSFGQYLKFMIIAGIVIAICIFLGGQALQIKKSWEKGE